jgi:hypothetical protein
MDVTQPSAYTYLPHKSNEPQENNWFFIQSSNDVTCYLGRLVLKITEAVLPPTRKERKKNAKYKGLYKE